ncbi:MAG: hypothetical protein AABY13_00460 [Nanoarchaeota archaeon]
MKGVIEKQRAFDAAHGWDWRNLPLDQQIEKLKYLIIALTGELGEVAEPFKKFLRKSEREGIDLKDYEHVRMKLREELVDVLIYLMKMADVAGIDLEEAYDAKLAINERKHAGFATGASTTTRFDKLVRDKIPAIIHADGKTAKVRVATDNEYPIYLLRKLKEETAEFEKNPTIEELADLLEVVHSLAHANKITIQELESVRQMKAADRGSFVSRIILEETE